MYNFNDLTPGEIERLALLFEECGEVIQIVGKIIRHGYQSYHPKGGPVNRELLLKEIGHVLAAFQIMQNAGDFAGASVEEFKEQKLKSIGQWLHHQEAYK